MTRALPWTFACAALALIACVPTAGPDPKAAGTSIPAAPTASAPAPSGSTSAPAPAARGGTVTVRFLDVGQGDSALVTTDDGHAVLIDAGPPEAAPQVARALETLGKTGLDAVILSHAHADHIGALDTLVARFSLGQWLDPGVVHGRMRTYERVWDTLGDRHIPLKFARRGDQLALGAHADIHVLLPREPLLTGTRSDLNANSIVLRLDHHARGGDTRFLFAGDAEAPTEKRLMEDRPSLRADVLKVAHHGSKHASAEPLVSAVAPRLAVISCGMNNDYGHPHAETLARLDAHHVTVARTDVQGDVTVTSDDRGLSWITGRPGDSAAMHAPGKNAFSGATGAD